MRLDALHLKTRRHPDRAFAMIELMVVIAFIAILSTLGILSYASIREDGEPQAAAKRVLGELSAGRQKAISANAPFRVFVQRQENKLWVDELDPAGAVVRRQIDPPVPLPDFVRVIGMTVEGDEVPAVGGAIRFFPDGRSDNAVIYLARRDADTSVDANITTIKVFGPTGAAKAYYDQRR